MEKNTLIAGKDFPDGREFADSFSLKNRNVVLTCTGKESENVEGDSSRVYSWNKSSPLSARGLVLNCENFKGALNEAILYFDEPLVASLFESASLQNCTQIIDDFISGYQFLTFELVSRKVSKIVFIHKTNSSLSETIASNSAHTSRVSNPLISACGAAFDSFAENMAAELTVTKKLIPVLVRGDISNETMARDGELASWLAEYLDGIDGLKNPPSPKQCISWIKPGSKVKSGFFH